jgi:hypothetical protein
MSRWTQNKGYYSKHGRDIWITTPNIYKITTAQKDFYVRSYRQIDYKTTLRELYKQGYTNIVITYLGRDVTF